MRFLLIITALLIILSCKGPDNFTQQYYGDAEVLISDRIISDFITEAFNSDTLDLCSCWRNGDSLGVTLESSNYSGLSIRLSEKNGLVEPIIVYYSDFAEFDGKFELHSKLTKKHVSLTIKNSMDSIHLTGDLRLEAEENEHYKLKRNISAAGRFNCSLKK
ncbi:hypothetical protein O3Q51_18275 [Cryomorphaceae bacterium 1068]|nr:hypothetical protein [Cryomorphaceae bacterium 1068]